MANDRRLAYEREALFDQIKIDGLATISWRKFNILGGGKNWSPRVAQTWVEAWREYNEDEEADLKVLKTGGNLWVLWDASSEGEPLEMSRA